MTMKLALILLIGVELGAGALAQAQDESTTELDQKQTMSQSQAQGLIRDFGIPPTSKFYSQLLTSFTATVSQGGGTVIPKERMEQTKTPAKVIRHIRSKDGIPLPTEAQAIKAMGFDTEAIKRQGQELANKYIAQAERYKDGQNIDLSYPAIPRCIADQQTRTQFDENRGKESEQVLLDMLFVDKGKAPLNPDDVYGKGVEVVQFDPTNGAMIGNFASTIGVECLPYRVRVTPAFIYRLTGQKALANVDKPPAKEKVKGR